MTLTEEATKVVRVVEWNDVGKVTAEMTMSFYVLPNGQRLRCSEVRTTAIKDGKATLEAVYRP